MSPRRKWSADPVLQAARDLVDAERERRHALIVFNRAQRECPGSLRASTFWFQRLEHSIALLERKREELVKLAREWSKAYDA